MTEFVDGLARRLKDIDLTLQDIDRRLAVLESALVEWHLAYCNDCDMVVPFSDREERDRWIDEHSEARTHFVEARTEWRHR